MSRKSKAVPPKNNNKNESSEFNDDSMICDDWVDVTEKYIINNTTESSPVTNDIPSKSDTSFDSPKIKKRKLRIPPSFDEILEKLKFDTLYLNFTKLLQFLQSANKEMCFPFISKQYEEFFKMIMQDVNLLKSRSLDANYRDICDKIIEVASFKKSGFLLTYNYEYRKEFSNTVLVVKKMDMKNPSRLDGPILSSSSDTRQSSSPTDMDPTASPKRSTKEPISNGFKIHCIRTTLAFVKNKVTKNIEFPELSSDQAHFMQLLLESVITLADFDNSAEVNELYRALWEAVKIHSLKYDFRINTVDTWGEKKSLVFEKLPKLKPVQNAAKQIAISTTQPVTSTKPPKVSVSQPVTNTKPPKVSVSQPVTSTKQPIVSGNQPVTSTKQPVVSANQPVTTTKQPVVNANQPVTSTKQPVVSANQPVTNTKQPTVSGNQPVTNTKQPILSGNQPVTSTKSPIVSANQPVTNTKQPVISGNQPVTCTNQPAGSSQPVPSNNQLVVGSNHIMNQPKKLSKKKLIKLKNRAAFVNRLPRKFVLSTFKTIIEFLSDDNRDYMIVVARNEDETVFCRKCVEWGRFAHYERIFEGEYKPLFKQIVEHLSCMKCELPKLDERKNLIGGMREVIYVKKLKVDKITGKNVIKPQEVANTEQTTDFKVPNVFTSLRNKKKNKKLKNKNLVKCKNKISVVGLSNKISFKSSKQNEHDDTSDVSSSSRGASLDRKVKRKAKKMNQREPQDADPNVRGIANGRRMRWRDNARKEQLIEALSVPVQSDKAMKIMRGMGWSGGALGARGDGITEPIMPALDIRDKRSRGPDVRVAKGAGFGHGKTSQPEIVPKKHKAPKIGTSWPTNDTNTEIDTQPSENDVIVEKTKQLLLDNLTFDKIIKGDFTNPITRLTDPIQLTVDSKGLDFEPPKTTNSKATSLIAPSNTTISATGPQKVTSAATQPPNASTSKSEPPKATNSKKLIVNLPTQTRYHATASQSPDSNIELPQPRNFRFEMLQSVLELLTTDSKSKTLTFDKAITKKNKQYMMSVLECLRYNGNVIVPWQEQDVVDRIVEKYKELPDVVVRGYVSENKLEVEYQKLPFKNNPDDQMNYSLISEEDIPDISLYIQDSAYTCQTRKALDALKFRVLILLKILQFVKSNNEEFEVLFNKVVPRKQRLVIDSIMESVNMRQKIGGSTPEKKLSKLIKSYIKDAFLTSMFNHQYTAVTLSKHFRFKRLNRPDNVEKRKSQTTVDLDNFTSTSRPTDTAEITDNEYEATGKENDGTGNDYDITGDDYNSDANSSGEEDDTKIISKVLPPRDETVSMYEYLYLYDPTTYSYKQNKVADDKFDLTPNNDIGNGNVVIDNNDNQVIDMKNVDAQTKRMDVDNPEMEAEYLFCVDNGVEEVDNEEMLIDDFNSEEIKYSEKFFDHSKDVETKNDQEYNMEKNRNDNIDVMIDEVLSNTENAVDQKVQFQVQENISEYPNIVEIKTEIKDEPMKEIGLDKPIEEICIKEELTEVIITNQSSKEIDVESKRMDDEEISKRTEDITIKTENKTDCDINFDKDNLDLSEENCDNQSLVVNHFETGQIENTLDLPDKKYSEIKNVYIVNIQYPTEIITKEKAKTIQEFISKQILLAKELPLLKCHGVQNGALIYTCHNKNTFDFLENAIKEVGDLKVLNTKNSNKMALKLFCLFNFDTVYLFNMIELYNKDISTKEWVVEKREYHDGFTIFVVRMDKISIDFIHASHFALFAGVDKVEFSLIWE